MQVEGSLELASDLSAAVLDVGKLTIGPRGVFAAGTPDAPHVGSFTLRVKHTLVDTCEYADGQPSVDVFGSLSLVGAAAVGPASMAPNGTAFYVRSAAELIAAEDGAVLQSLQAGGVVGVRSGAGHEVAEIKSVADSVVSLAQSLALQHTGPVRLHALSRSVKIVSEGAPGVLRVWSGEPTVIEGLSPSVQRRRLQTAGLTGSTSLRGRALLHGHDAQAADEGNGAPRHSCAGSTCGGGFVSSIAARDVPSVAVRLHNVEVVGLGGPDGAAVEVEDPACQHRWPASPTTVDVFGSSLRGLQGSGLRLRGCVARMRVRCLRPPRCQHEVPRWC